MNTSQFSDQIWELHRVNELIFQTLVTFLSLVQLISNFRHSVSLILLLFIYIMNLLQGLDWPLRS